MDTLPPMLQRLVALAPAAIAIVAGTLVLSSLLSRAFRLLATRTSFSDRDLSPFQRLGRGVIYGAGIVALLGLFGLNLGGLWTMLATVLGLVAIGFVAVWSVLSNTLCTLIILVCRPFEVGDEIELSGETASGRVVDLNFIYTTLLAADGSLIQIPNNLFLQKVIKRRRSNARISLAEQLAAAEPAKML